MVTRVPVVDLKCRLMGMDYPPCPAANRKFYFQFFPIIVIIGPIDSERSYQVVEFFC